MAVRISKRQPEGDRERQQKVAVGGDDGLVHRQREEHRGEEREDLEREGQHQKVCHRPAQAGDTPQEGADADARRRLRHLEAAGRCELECHAGEVARDIGEGETAQTFGRVVDRHAGAPDGFQHHEMVQVPVQDAGGPQHAEFIEVQTQRPCGEAEAIRDRDHVLERRSLQREAVAPAQRTGVGMVAVIAGDHGEAGEPAFRGFRLQDDRQAPAPAEPEPLDIHALSRPVREWSGSRIHSKMRRVSIRTSASSCIPGWSGALSP